MDNHKDFIHIDDVFKDLRNGEDQEPSGAWLRMKELLDKEMPAGAPVSAGKSFRRYLIPLAALLLIGGGIAYNKINKNSNTESHSVSIESNSPTTISPSHGNDIASNLSSDGRRGTGHELSSSNKLNKNGNHNKGIVAGSTLKENNSGKSNTTGTSISKDNATVTANTPKENNHTKTGKAKNSNAIAPTQGNIAATKAQKKPAKSSPSSGVQNTTAKLIEEQHIIEQIKPKTEVIEPNTSNVLAANKNVSTKGANRPPKEENQFNSNNKLKQIAATLNNRVIVQSPDGNLYKEERDTFKRIDLVSRAVASSNTAGRKTMKTVLDTIAVTRVEKVSYVPLNTLELVALRKIQITNTPPLVPISNIRERTISNEMVNLVPLANYKVGSRKVDPSKFNQLIQNTSQGIANYFDGSRNFYAAILVGGNASFGNPGAFGMQLGVAALYQLSERLTLAAELKYANHYFSNYSIEDKSVTFENISSQQLSGLEWLFSGTQKTTTAAYKINSMGALEIPITLSYNLGRVSIFGGLNMAYAFPINWNKENTINTSDVQRTQTQNQNPFRNASFTVNEQTDFTSRFGLGYVWGLNYDVSRKVSLDARLTQILWDNSKGNTDAIKKLFQVPTLQVSFGYYFGRKDKVVYIMDKR